MIALNITPEEVSSGTLREDHLHAALNALAADGFVALNDVVDRGHLAMLRERMLEDLAAILARPDAPYNFNTGNVQQDPPPFPPYLFKDVLLNEQVIAITRAVLGPGVKNGYYSGNTALPGGKRQPVHPDAAQLWANLTHPTPAYGFVVNVPVVDMSPENGSTELWPGTHLDTTYSVHDHSIRIPEEVLARRRTIREPIQPSVRAGSVVIRDIRLWHAGMPNYTDIPRPMIAMIHWAVWWAHSDKPEFPKETEPFFKHKDLWTDVRFVEGPINHTLHNKAYDLQK